MAARGQRPSMFKRQRFIKHAFQGRFILLFLGVLAAGGLISVGMIYLTTQDTLTSTFAHSRLSVQTTASAILPSVIWTTLATTLGLGVVVALLTLLISHRLAGPMYRFERDIETMSKGELSHRVRIRRGDQFQEMADGLNDMAGQLAGELRQIRSELDALSQRPDLSESIRLDVEGLITRMDEKFKL